MRERTLGALAVYLLSACSSLPDLPPELGLLYHHRAENEIVARESLSDNWFEASARYKEPFNVGGYECRLSEGKLFIQGTAYNVPEDGYVAVYQKEGSSDLEITLRNERRDFIGRRVVDPRQAQSQEPGLTATIISP